MKKILNIKEAISITKLLRRNGKKIVLVGGCFDILHAGHVTFLKKAKKQGDVLMILLESDRAIQKIKGRSRPINPQLDRPEVLSELRSVDFIILLPYLKSNKEYDNLILQLKPHIIATTKGDPNKTHKIRQAQLIDTQIIEVTERIAKTSTSELAKKILTDYYL